MQIGTWTKNGINLTRNTDKISKEISKTLKNKTIVVTTILVKKY